jgi:predicted transposase/invertase (TIGR01784 family)
MAKLNKDIKRKTRITNNNFNVEEKNNLDTSSEYNFETSYNLDNLPTGKIQYGLTNDYMFRAVMQGNQNALKGLLYALLDLPDGSIENVTITNPILLGKAIDKKNCILDIKLTLNNKKIINLEMQIENYGNWPERSLTYLCRSFDNLKPGEDYQNVMPTIHIGILDFNLEHLTPEFYSEFKMMNTKNHEIYSDKFVLRVLNLHVLDDDDIIKEPEELYHWAKVFKARTWEEIKMLANDNKYIKDTVVTMYQMSEDEKIREQCLASDLYNFDLASAKTKGYTTGHKVGFEVGHEVGHAAGLQEGADKKEKTIILNMHNKNMSPEEISELTDIPLEKIMSLIQDNN